MAKATRLKRNTAKMVNPSTASTSHQDHAGNIAGGAAGGGSNGAVGAGPEEMLYSMGVGPVMPSSGSGSGLDGIDMVTDNGF